MIDEEEIKPLAPSVNTGELGRIFTFNGKTLNPMSWHHTFAYWRIASDKMSALESACILVWLLQRDGKAANAIRGDEAEEKARMEAIEWASKAGLGRGDFNERILAVAKEINEDREQAESVEPAGGVSGNG